MRIFLSYASQDSEEAKSIYLALRDQGHKVFFDRADLPAGEEYHNRIRAAIDHSHLFVFLISPNAVDTDSYTLTELTIAEKSNRRLLPVMLRETDIARLPAAIQAVTIYRSDGNLAANVAAEAYRIAGDLRRKRVKRFAVASAIVAIVAAGVFYATAGRKKEQHAGKDGAPAVLIRTGSFIMGDDENSPRREIFVNAFYLDKHEVTVARYAGFLKATGNVKPPEEWDTVDIQIGAELPVVGVDWHDADSYCRWAGKRLPAEAEWERAARGTDERQYPWGNQPPTGDLANFAVGARFSYSQALMPVGRYKEGKSPFGLYDMAGNVWEWVQDWYDGAYYERGPDRNPTGPEEGQFKVLRGGAWSELPKYLLAYGRFKLLPNTRNSYTGFRCAKS